jgi:hypothetical protein
MSDSPAWQAALHVFDHPILRGRVDAFVDIASEYVDPEILREPWSSGERLLIEVALSLSSSEQTVSLGDVFACLDDRSAKRVFEAIEIFRIGLGCQPVLD